MARFIHFMLLYAAPYIRLGYVYERPIRSQPSPVIGLVCPHLRIIIIVTIQTQKLKTSVKLLIYVRTISIKNIEPFNNM